MTSNRQIIPCPGCDRKIRIPTDKGHIRFSCPDCNAPLEWSPDGSHEVRDVEVEPVPIERQAPAQRPDDPPPRAHAVYYAAGALIAGYAAYWSSSEGSGLNWAPLAFSAALIFAIYLAYRTVRVATQLGVWPSIGLLVAAQFGVSLFIPILSDVSTGNQSDVAEAVEPLDPDLGEGHFDGRTADNTTPSQMDTLMEGW